MSQEFKEDQLEEMAAESTHVSGGWSRPEEEDELLKELNDIIMDEDEDDESYEEELRQRQFMAMEREKRSQRSRTGRMIGLFLTFIATILFMISILGFYRGVAYSKSIRELEKFKQDISNERQDITFDDKTIEKINNKYMVAANVMDKTDKETKEEAEKKKEIEEAKAKEVAEKAKKAQEEANAKQQELQAQQREEAEANHQNNLSQNQSQTQAEAVPQQNYNFILPNVDSAYIPESTIANMDSYQLYLARNEIYARHGRAFKRQDLKEYFGKQSWYEPIYDPATFDSWGLSVFNEYERANLDLILRYER